MVLFQDLYETKQWYLTLVDKPLKQVEKTILNDPDTKQHIKKLGWDTFSDAEINKHINISFKQRNNIDSLIIRFDDVPAIWVDDPHKEERDPNTPLIGEMWKTILMFDSEGNNISGISDYEKYIEVFPTIYNRIKRYVDNYIKKIHNNKDKLSQQYYIRFGTIPKNEISMNYATNQPEKGVSVYYAEWNIDKNKWEIEENEENQSTYSDLLNSYRNIFLVTGKRVGFGSDNEPLIKDIKVVKKLSNNEIIKNKNFM